MNKMFFIRIFFIFFCTFQCQGALWSGFMNRASKKKVKIKFDDAMANVCLDLLPNTKEIPKCNTILGAENIKIAYQLDSDQISTDVDADDESTFLYTQDIFQCVAVGIIKFSSDNKIERFLFHLNFFNQISKQKNKKLDLYWIPCMAASIILH